MPNPRITALAALLVLSLPGHSIAQKREPGDKTHGEEWQIRERERWFRKTRELDAEGDRARTRRMQAVEEARAQLGAGAGPRVLAAQWVSVGPSPMTMQGWAMGNVAGRINAVAIDPTNANVIYVGAAGGGVWKTTNGGSSWVAVFDAAGTQNIGAVAIAPTNPSVVWVGTGDPFQYAGMGVFRSTDGGATWSARNGTGGNVMTSGYVTSLVLHPTDPNIVVVSGSSGGGIFRTTDAGANWSRVFTTSAWEIVRHPTNASFLYAAVNGSDCYRSTDGGATWANASTGLGGGGRTEIAISPSNPQVLYLVNESADLYRSTDGAATWALRNGGACEGQCWYNMTIEVSLGDPDTLYVGTIRHFKSTNGGTTLTPLTATWGGSQAVHQDTHVIRRHPTDANTIFVATDGGLWKTTNAGTSYTNLNGNMNMTMFYDVATHPTLDTVMLGGSQDNSSEAYTGNVTWDVVEVTGDGFVNAINRSNPSYCYVASYPWGNSPAVLRSTTGVNGNYAWITSSISDNASWVTPYMLDPVAPDTMYLGGTRVWRSTNRGTSWAAISGTLTSSTMISLAVGKNDNSVIYAGADASDVFRSTNAGGTWSNVQGNITGNHVINDIDVDPANALHVYVAISGTSDPNLWYSTTGGGTWTAATNGLPGVTANSVLIAPGPYRVYVGNDLGVWRSDAGDAGPYVPDMSGMALGVAVTDLEYNAATGTLTAGTYGRGAWQSYASCTAPVAAFVGNPTSGVAPLAVNFVDQTSNAPTSWAWDFGDGGTSTAQNPSHTYTAVGSYTVTLAATNACGSDSETKVNYITVTTCPPPSTDFSGNPTSGPAPLSVAFADLSGNGPTSWSWSFGDGGTSAAQSPSHTYTAAGVYDVSLTAANACGANTATKIGYITVTGGATTEEVVTGAGAGASNAPLVKTWNHASPPGTVASWTAYGSPQYGANVASTDVIGGGVREVTTGPGPGDIYGPQVRGFQPDGTAIAKINFYAYGTLRYGVAVGGGNVDGDAHGEILTGPGPGAVFGPHVRGFNFDGATLAAMPKISFFAYGTLRYGVRDAGGDFDADGFAEIVTGAGAGQVFGPHVRTFNYDNASIASRASFFAFASGAFGAAVAAGNTDADVTEELLVAHGPDPSHNGEVRGYDVAGAAVTQAWSVTAFSALGGAEVAAGDMGGDGKDELVAGAGWGAANASEVRLFSISGSGGTPLATFSAYAGQTYGTKVAAGDTGTP